MAGSTSESQTIEGALVVDRIAGNGVVVRVV